MTMRYSVVDVKMNERHTQRITVGPWEVPILQAVHSDHVKFIEDISLEREPPDAEAEFNRLVNKYRSGHNDDGESKLPYVAQIYGTHAAGVAKLHAAIQESVVEMTRGKIEIQPKQKSAAVI